MKIFKSKFKFIFYTGKNKFNLSTNNTITLERYSKEVEKTLNYINDYLEVKELDIFDNIVFSDGVLKITLAKNKNFVLNIQRPNLQLWLSSPISGPQRFEFDLNSQKWKNNRNSEDLLEILNKELNDILAENKIDSSIDLNYKY